jgi:hypothetical protein
MQQSDTVSSRRVPYSLLGGTRTWRLLLGCEYELRIETWQVDWITASGANLHICKSKYCPICRNFL